MFKAMFKARSFKWKWANNLVVQSSNHRKKKDSRKYIRQSLIRQNLIVKIYIYMFILCVTPRATCCSTSQTLVGPYGPTV